MRSFDVLFLFCAWINGWVNKRAAGDLRRHRSHPLWRLCNDLVNPIRGLVQDCSISSALAMVILQSCNKLSVYGWVDWFGTKPFPTTMLILYHLDPDNKFQWNLNQATQLQQNALANDFCQIALILVKGFVLINTHIIIYSIYIDIYIY